MTEDKPLQKTIATVLDVPHAPVLYFEEATNFGTLNGIVNVTLAIYRTLPDGKGGVATDLVSQCSLRGNLQAALSLRNALNDVLLMAVPPADGGKAN